MASNAMLPLAIRKTVADILKIPESSTRLVELIIGVDIFFSGIFNMSATVLRIANGSIALDAVDPLIPDKV